MGDDHNDHDENNDCPPCGIRGEPIEDPKHECCDNHCTEDSDPHLGFQNLIAMITADMITELTMTAGMITEVMMTADMITELAMTADIITEMMMMKMAQFDRCGMDLADYPAMSFFFVC